jgi:hypothetical protein
MVMVAHTQSAEKAGYINTRGSPWPVERCQHHPAVFPSAPAPALAIAPTTQQLLQILDVVEPAVDDELAVDAIRSR